MTSKHRHELHTGIRDEKTYMFCVRCPYTTEGMPGYFDTSTGERFALAGHRPCNYQSTVQRHNFGRYCRCCKFDPYGYGGLARHHMSIGEPHICATCGRTFTK
jgi:hypothetical protein